MSSTGAVDCSEPWRQPLGANLRLPGEEACEVPSLDLSSR
jgi:hypothetical protein